MLCSGSVHFILRHEVEDSSIIFINAWGATGQEIAGRHGMTSDDLHKSFLVVVDGKPMVKSTAALEIARRFRRPWRWLTLFHFVPIFLRDRAYSLIARMRYRWFGREDAWFVPPPDSRDRFIER